MNSVDNVIKLALFANNGTGNYYVKFVTYLYRVIEKLAKCFRKYFLACPVHCSFIIHVAFDWQRYGKTIGLATKCQSQL